MIGRLPGIADVNLYRVSAIFVLVVDLEGIAVELLKFFRRNADLQSIQIGRLVEGIMFVPDAAFDPVLSGLELQAGNHALPVDVIAVRGYRYW